MAVVAICLFSETIACPCNFNSETSEVTCDPNTQDSLPFDLPDCLDTTADKVGKALHIDTMPMKVPKTIAIFLPFSFRSNVLF